ncbi:MAG: hypothetical protein HY814_06225 [Candidatus Riflebacteria bacterium]|nr:hypothetical protein [Candidatus Riflebacteria bacterium]
MLVLVPVVLLILLTVLFTVNYLMRTQYHRGHAYRVGQEAVYLAEGGLALANSWLSSDEGRALVTRMTQLAVEQLGSSGSPADNLVVLEEELELPGLALLTAGFPGATVAARLRLFTGKPVLRSSPVRGLAPDPAEVEAWLEVLSECTTRELTRRIRSRTPSRIVNVLPPLVSRFALMVCSSGSAARSINCLDYDSEKALFRDASTGARSWPLEVCGAATGLSQSVSPGSDQELDCVVPRTGASTSGEPLDAARTSGWVYLGGPDPWFLQLTLGAGLLNPLEEHGLLRRAAYVLPGSSLGEGFQEKIYFFGFARGAGELAMLGRARARWRSPSTGEEVSERTSLLHLSGNARSPGPTVVLGPVFRRFLSFSKVRRGDSGPFTSFVHVETPEEFARVGAAFQTLTGQGYDAYQRVMARVVEEPYNRSHDYLVTSEERVAGPAGSRLDPGKTPAIPELLLDEQGLEPVLAPAVQDPLFLYPAPQGGPVAAAPIRLGRVGSEGRASVLFTGDPGKLDGYDALMRSRVTLKWPRPGPVPQPLLGPFLRKGPTLPELDLRGQIVHVSQSPLHVPGVRVVGSGTLVADGDLVLEGPILTAPCEMLTLVSLGGSIRLLSPGPIHACLVAPRGQVHPPALGGLEIHGSVVCHDLDNFPEFLANSGPKRFVYDPRTDPSDGETWKRFYRLAATAPPERFLERKQ